MKVRALIVAGIAMAALAGCVGTVAPTPGAAPTAAQKESGDLFGDDASSDAGGLPGAGNPGGSGPGPVAAADPNTQAGGVSALPAGIECGQGKGCVKKKEFDFTFSGIANPVCTEDVPNGGAKALVKYAATGTVGAVLLDGTDVDLYHCEALTVRFQAGSGSTARCQDIAVKANCMFNGIVSFDPDVAPPQATLFTYGSYGSPDPSCGETGDPIIVPVKIDLAFSTATAEKVPDCKSMQIQQQVPLKFTLSGAADTVCKEAPKIGAKALVAYNAYGTVGAVLSDGADANLSTSNCEALRVRFQAGSGSTARCQDIPVKANCQFGQHISFYPDVDPPQATLFYGAYGSPNPSCGETGDRIIVPDKVGVTFEPAAPDLMSCLEPTNDGSPPTIDSSILSHFKMKLLLP